MKKIKNTQKYSMNNGKTADQTDRQLKIYGQKTAQN